MLNCIYLVPGFFLFSLIFSFFFFFSFLVASPGLLAAMLSN